MSAVAWSTIKTAIHAWFVAGTGLAADRVLFSGQNIARPAGAGAWVSLKFGNSNTEGRSEVRREVNPSPSAGAEMITRTRGLTRVTYTATCYPPAAPDDGSAVPDASEAHALLHDVVMASDTAVRRSLLSIAGIGLLRCEGITQLDGVINSTRFEPRATMNFSFLVPSEIIETLTNIQTANLEIDTTSPTIVRPFTVILDP